MLKKEMMIIKNFGMFFMRKAKTATVLPSTVSSGQLTIAISIK